MELAAQSGHIETCAGARLGLHLRAQAKRDRPAQHHPAGGNPARCRRSQRRIQSRQRRRSHRRPGNFRASRHRHGFVYRLDARRHPRRQGGGEDGEARLSGTRRQVSEYHHGGRRSGKGGAGRRSALLYQHRPIVPGADAHAGPSFAARRRHRAREEDGRERSVGRSARPADADGAGRQQSAVRQNPGPDREGPPGRRDPGVRRTGPSGGLQSRLFCATHGVRGCHIQDDDRQTGNLRSRAFHDDVRH